MERKCTRCGSIEILDDFHKICYECFVELDLAQHDIELKKELASTEVVQIMDDGSLSLIEDLQEEEE